MEIKNSFEQETVFIKPAGFIKKNIAGLLDAAIFLFGVYQAYALLPIFFLPAVNLFILFILYRGLCIFTMNGTLGMILCNTIFLKSDQTDLTASEKAAAACFILLDGAGYYEK
jgi:uncharacterized RDD family membrane protein YckC